MRKVGIILLLLIGIAPNLLKAQTLNYKLASLYIYNFTQYIDWPKNDNSSTFVIGVYGTTPITDELRKATAGKHVGGRPISITVIKNLAEATECSILFISPSEQLNIKKISDQFKGKHILLICDKESMIRKGASISIYLDEDDDYKTKFDLNKEYIESNGLFVSKALLSLAAKVY